MYNHNLFKKRVPYEPYGMINDVRRIKCDTLCIKLDEFLGNFNLNSECFLALNFEIQINSLLNQVFKKSLFIKIFNGSKTILNI